MRAVAAEAEAGAEAEAAANVACNAFLMAFGNLSIAVGQCQHGAQRKCAK